MTIMFANIRNTLKIMFANIILHNRKVFVNIFLKYALAAEKLLCYNTFMIGLITAYRTVELTGDVTLYAHWKKK
jgi:hypothetical protein